MKDDKELTDFQIKKRVVELRYGDKWDVHTNEPAGFIGIIPKDCMGKVAKIDPFDNALNLELRDEYGVTVDYHHRMVFIFGDKGRVYRFDDDKTKINRAVLICILESVK